MMRIVYSEPFGKPQGKLSESALKILFLAVLAIVVIGANGYACLYNPSTDETIGKKETNKIVLDR